MTQVTARTGVVAAVPAVSQSGWRLYAAVGPALRAGDEAAGYPLLALCGAVSAAVAPVDDLVRDTDVAAGWTAAFSLAAQTGPGLRWLAQLAGVTVPPGASDDAARQAVRQQSGQRRGTPTAIIAAAAAVLPPGVRVDLVERDGNAWTVTVRTYASQVTAAQAALVRAALAAAKPAGYTLSYTNATGGSYAQTRQGTYSARQTRFPTYGSATSYVPGS